MNVTHYNIEDIQRCPLCGKSPEWDVKEVFDDENAAKWIYKLKCCFAETTFNFKRNSTIFKWNERVNHYIGLINNKQVEFKFVNNL